MFGLKKRLTVMFSDVKYDQMRREDQGIDSSIRHFEPFFGGVILGDTSCLTFVTILSL